MEVHISQVCKMRVDLTTVRFESFTLQPTAHYPCLFSNFKHVMANSQEACNCQQPQTLFFVF